MYVSQFAIIGCCLATNLLLVNCTATYEKLGGAGNKVNIVVDEECLQLSK